VVSLSNKGKTKYLLNKNGGIAGKCVSPKNVQIKALGLVRYSDFGASGDGKTDV